MQLWLPGYEHDPEHGAGLNVTAGSPKVVIHTTESGPGSLAAVRNMWRGAANWGRGLPHFIAEGNRYVQLLPLNVGAYTLENKAGGADTNRSGPAIQVEIVGRARNGLTDVDIEALGRWLADLVLAGLPIDLSQHPPFYGEGAGWILAAYDARQRFDADTYVRFNGFCGHAHVPENAHWDPGPLDGDRVERIARAHLASFTDPPPEEDDMATTILATTAPNSRWFTEVAGGEPGKQAIFKMLDTDQFVRPCTHEEIVKTLGLRDYAVAMGGKDTVQTPGVLADWFFASRTLLPREVWNVDGSSVAPTPATSFTPAQIAQLGEQLGVNLAANIGAGLADLVADELADRLDD